MGRPTKREDEKLRSFVVRLQPQDTGRILKLLEIIMQLEQQEIIRRLIDSPQSLGNLWDSRRMGTTLPSRNQIAVMPEAGFEALLAGVSQRRRRRGRGVLTRPSIAAHS